MSPPVTVDAGFKYQANSVAVDGQRPPRRFSAPVVSVRRSAVRYCCRSAPEEAAQPRRSMTTELTPVAYVISAVEGVVGESTVKRYAELAGPAIEHFGGRFIVSNTEPVVVEGESPSNYISMVEFPSMEDAKAWYNSPEYAEARDLTPAAFRGRLLILVEGV
jgi:uncharacterized protein (DUF1330 family)